MRSVLNELTCREHCPATGSNRVLQVAPVCTLTPKGLMGSQPRGTRATVKNGREARANREAGHTSYLNPNGPTTSPVGGTGTFPCDTISTGEGHFAQTKCNHNTHMHTVHSPGLGNAQTGVHSTGHCPNGLTTLAVEGTGKNHCDTFGTVEGHTAPTNHYNVFDMHTVHGPVLDNAQSGVHSVHCTKPIVNKVLVTDGLNTCLAVTEARTRTKNNMDANPYAVLSDSESEGDNNLAAAPARDSLDALNKVGNVT